MSLNQPGLKFKMPKRRPRLLPLISCPLIRLLRFQSLPPVASDHDDGEEGAHHGGEEEDEDDGNADCPDAWGKEGL